MPQNITALELVTAIIDVTFLTNLFADILMGQLSLEII